MARPRFVVRVIRGCGEFGRVRIGGRRYRCRGAARFHGMKAAFGLYYIGDRLEPVCCLWGSEEQFRASDQPAAYESLWPGPFCEDGKFKWEWWHAQA